MKQVFTSFLFCLVCIALRAESSAPTAIDARLGAPFATRPRAVLGADAASIVVIEFSSFRCTHCRTFHEEVFPKLREQYIDTGKVQWVTINASNEIADRSSPVFLAARAAQGQGRYWETIDGLYHPGSSLPDSITAHLQDPVVRDAVATDFADYAALGLRGTPTFLIRKLGRDGRWTRAIIEDLQPLDYFQRTLDGLLQKS